MARNDSAVHPEIPDPDDGLFGPDSASWKVLGERTVILGGMRALLMHAAHPLVAAATAQTGTYASDPWGRHRRTLELTYTLVFGARAEAIAAARRINAAHRSVRGVDPLTGMAYAATEPDLLLWVHASLVSSFLLYERLTVGALDPADRQLFCAEWVFLARLLGVPVGRVPSTPDRVDAWVDAVTASGVLRPTDGSALLAAIIRRPAKGLYGVKLRAAAFLALHTLPPPLRDLYGVDHRRVDQRLLNALCVAIRIGRRGLPERAHLIPPAVAARARTQRIPQPGRAG
ncbi:oxygenase MpaB family protein [Streptomyces platensis]|uniref:oxygenase MpaB family protein n=1 Tax=Streptomyces platensis TaxID=58346 RepID=UPI00340B537A